MLRTYSVARRSWQRRSVVTQEGFRNLSTIAMQIPKVEPRFFESALQPASKPLKARKTSLHDLVCSAIEGPKRLGGFRQVQAGFRSKSPDSAVWVFLNFGATISLQSIEHFRPAWSQGWRIIRCDTIYGIQDNICLNFSLCPYYKAYSPSRTFGWDVRRELG